MKRFFTLRMKIGELAARTGLTPSRIRYYEEIGLLRAVDRLPNGYRIYGLDAVTTLNVVVMAQQIGFTLEEMRLAPGKDKGWDHALIEKMLVQKIAEIEAEEARLAAGKARLKAVQSAIALRPDGLDCAANEARILSLIEDG